MFTVLSQNQFHKSWFSKKVDSNLILKRSIVFYIIYLGRFYQQRYRILYKLQKIQNLDPGGKLNSIFFKLNSFPTKSSIIHKTIPSKIHVRSKKIGDITGQFRLPSESISCPSVVCPSVILMIFYSWLARTCSESRNSATFRALVLWKKSHSSTWEISFSIWWFWYRFKAIC